MNQNVTASFGLSVLIVVFFAVALYQPDPPPPKAVAGSQAPLGGPTLASHPESDDRNARLTRGTRHVSPADEAPAQRVERVSRVVRTAPPPSPAMSRPDSSIPAQERLVAVAHPTSRTQPLKPQEAFTQVRPGETLADVAARVYGPATTGGGETLWRANRDILDKPSTDAPLRPGTLIRTP
jgi:hypothetical protein